VIAGFSDNHSTFFLSKFGLYEGRGGGEKRYHNGHEEEGVILVSKSSRRTVANWSRRRFG